MSQPIVIAHHLIWTAYGWWLPNDPRGSGSRIIRNDILNDLGALHYGRKRVQPAGYEVRRFYQRATAILKHPLLTFDARARDEISMAFGQVIHEQQFTCYACAIMLDHIHILIRKHKYHAEEIMDWFKEAGRNRLIATGHRTENHPTWAAGGGWKVFLDHPDDVRRTIDYINRNPDLAGLPPQHWPFVRVYDGWPLHPGHSPNSPYAKRLREAGRYRP
jgi:REP element-mobilizing transposase RayT